MAYEIERVFFVMMENRSFDHMLGYLHARNPEIDGIRRTDEAWLDRAANGWSGERYRPAQTRDPGARIAADPPHGRSTINEQLGRHGSEGFAMDGFASTYAKAEGPPRVDKDNPPASMSWFDGSDVPVFDFFSRNFAICDRWFCSLPAGTQPNRMMAMGGSTKRDNNHFPMPNQRLVYDWLNERNIRWRVYHDGLPFFAMMPSWTRHAATSKAFRDFKRMADDVVRESPDDFPQVIFIEPTYADAPHQPGTSNDDHAPDGIARGQAFLGDVYRAITRNPALFEKSVTIITYDEHGGFFDHVSPPRIETRPPAGATYQPFESLGVRVPALIISPYVLPGTVNHDLHDHCSLLKLLGELFGGGWGYEHPVNARPVGNILSILNNPAGRAAPAMPHLPATYLDPANMGTTALGSADDGRVPGTLPVNELQQSFQLALDQIREIPGSESGKFADLLAAFPPEPAVPPRLSAGQ